MRRLLYISSLLLILPGLYFIAPVYQFYAHRGEAPMPFWGYLTLAVESPTSSEVHVSQYEQAATQAIALLTEHQKNMYAPGISAAIAIDGELVWTGTAGWADIAAQEPMSSATQFRIGSTSKALTSTLLARLVQEKQLLLDTPLSEYKLSELNPNWKDITARQLSSHMSGLPHYKDNTEFSGLYRSIALNSSYPDVNDAVSLFDESELLFSPGEDFSYSSYGSVLLSALIQEAGQISYQSLMNKLVLQPLEMQATLPTAAQVDFENNAEHLATFYWREHDNATRVRPWRDVDLSHRLAGGGFISTPSDLVKLGNGFIDEDFINEAIRAQFWTPQQLNNGEVNEQHYAIGWRVHQTKLSDEIGDVLVANHGGVSRGSQSWLMVIPEYNAVIALNTNCKTTQFWDFAKVSKPIASLFLLAKAELTAVSPG
ncbi:serine hydrolase domain-containing protein [Planctobacterium marinum]|uniref:D-alanyl-D-alanine carboxypeptidase n=1 Tax=Planctobacterium marinum TaxID=1631968 RepID=A0AA48HRM0_9ALTE|nr:D-alanyl-D-alanine carboxypeptidase [Planctobacterium marinum]